MKKTGKNTFATTLLMSGVLNKNGRMYSTESLKDIEKKFGELSHPMLGEFGYPDGPDTSLTNASHFIKKLYLKKSKLPRKKKKEFKKAGLYDSFKKTSQTLCGEIELTTTDAGKMAKKLINGLVARPRGAGIVNKDGLVENYQLFSFDLIHKSEDSFKGIL